MVQKMRKCLLLALVIFLIIRGCRPNESDKDYIMPDHSNEKAPLPIDTARYYRPIYPKKKEHKQVEIYD